MATEARVPLRRRPVGGGRLVVACALLASALQPIAVGRTAVPEPGAALAGQLLVALDELRDPRFFHTVIYMVRHGSDGAMGLVVNRPLGDVPASELLGGLGIHDDRAQGTIRVHYGGPV